MTTGTALANIVALIMIYVGYVQRYSLLAVAGVLALAVTMYLHGRSAVRREVLPHLDRKVSEIERWIKDATSGSTGGSHAAIDVPELTDRVRSLRSSLRVWNRD